MGRLGGGGGGPFVILEKVMGAVYVGRLYQIQIEGRDPEEVEPCALGVDDDLGLVQADTRADLLAGRYWKRPKGARSRPCERLWYERRRKDYPGDRLWFHDMEKARVIIPLDKLKANLEGRSRALVTGPDVYECPQSGQFLCG